MARNLGQERARLTKISDVDGSEIEVSQLREFQSWSGFSIVADGPVVDFNDALVLAAVICLYHRHDFRNGVVTTTLSELARTLGKKADSGAVQSGLKRSLTRLASVRLKVSEPLSSYEKLGSCC